MMLAGYAEARLKLLDWFYLKMGLIAENHLVAFFIVTSYRSPLLPCVFGEDFFFFWLDFQVVRS